MRILREPMLAPSKPLTEEQLATLQFPLWASDKKDGFRILTFPKEGGLTRTFKGIPNRFLRMVFANLVPPYLDGELTVGSTFHETSSAVMSHEGTPQWTYHVFDCFKHPERPWKDRFEEAKDLVHACNPLLDIDTLRHTLLRNYQELVEVEEDAVKRGEEGIMLRWGDAPYKQGRSTIREQGLLKVKRFETDEAIIIGFEEQMENRNPQERSATGKVKRSTRSEGMVPTGMLGAFICQSDKFVYTFNVGGGMTDLQRRKFWKERDSLINKIICYKHTPYGQKDRPKSTVFKGFRDPIDIL